VNGEEHSFRSGTFRFKSDGSKLEFLHQYNNNTWGIGLNEQGDIFGSTANNNPSFFGGVPSRVHNGEKRMTAKMIASSPRFYPITPNIRQVDAFNAYTAGCGHAFATSSGFPKSWRNQRAFVCGPTGHLLGMYDVRPKGSGFESVNAYSLVASTDEWFSPIVAEVGPDGNLWIADWIYRLVYEKNHAPMFNLENASRQKLVKALGHDNMFWRLTAQRLLVDRGYRKAVPALIKILSQPAPKSLHALWALHGLGSLKQDLHANCLTSNDPALRRNAVRALSHDLKGQQMLHDGATLADKDLLVRLASFVKLASFPQDEGTRDIASLLMRVEQNAKDEWLRLPLESLGAVEANLVGYEKGPNLLPNPSFELIDGKLPKDWKVRTYSGGGAMEHTIETVSKSVKTGKSSLRISSEGGHDTSAYASVQLKSGVRYSLSAWIKADRVEGGGMGAVETVFVNPSAGRITVNCLFGGWGRSKGKAWFDDISLNEMVPIYKEIEKVENRKVDLTLAVDAIPGLLFSKTSLMAKSGAAARNYVPKNAKVIAQTPMVLPGTKYDLVFQVPTQKGNYPFLCTFPGHWRLMKGELIVQP